MSYRNLPARRTGYAEVRARGDDLRGSADTIPGAGPASDTARQSSACPATATLAARPYMMLD